MLTLSEYTAMFMILEFGVFSPLITDTLLRFLASDRSCCSKILSDLIHLNSNQCSESQFSGQSYKGSTIINYVSRVIPE